MRKLSLIAALSILAAVLAFQFLSFTPVGSDLSQPEIPVVRVADEPGSYCGVSLLGSSVYDGELQKNEILGDILHRFGRSNAEVYSVGQVDPDLFDVRRLRAGKHYSIIHERDCPERMSHFIYHPNVVDFVVLHFGDSLEVIRGSYPVDTVQKTLSGVIETSLYNSILDAGGSQVLVDALSDVYAWEIDFFGLQKDDNYRIVYSELQVNGESAGFGEIITAAFVHVGEEKLAFSFDQGEGEEFFDEEGESLRKTFLKAPLRFSRISSRFSYSRLHPIFKVRRPHLGVDYAAPIGTPVEAVGDGVITKAAWSGGAGRLVKVRHNSNYTTAYMHLSRYAKGIKPGTYVKQGQVIGYVGSSGHSTGPHLDFRFYKNGKAVDPLKVDPPSANPVTSDCMAPFQEAMNAQRRLLDEVAPASLLLAESGLPSSEGPFSGIRN